MTWYTLERSLDTISVVAEIRIYLPRSEPVSVCDPSYGSSEIDITVSGY